MKEHYRPIQIMVTKYIYHSVIWLIVLIDPSCIFAQTEITTKIDSLEKIFNAYPANDTSRKKVLKELIDATWQIDPQKNKIYNEDFLLLGKQLEDEDMIATANNNIGIYYCMNGNYEKGLENFLLALEIKEKLGNEKDLAKSYVNIGIVYSIIKEYDSSTNYYEKALLLSKKNNDLKGIANAKQSIAINLTHIGESINQDDVSQENEYFEKALIYYQEALDIFSKLEIQKDMLSCLNNLAALAVTLNKFELSIKYSSQSIELAKKMKIPYSESIAYGNRGDAKRQMKQFDLAEKDLLNSLKLAEENNFNTLLINPSKSLSLLYAEIGNYDKHKQYFILYNQLNEESLNEEKNKSILELKEKYETSQKEANNAILTARNSALEKDRNLAVAFAVITLLFLGILFYFFYKIIKQKKEIEKNNQLKDKLFTIVAHDLRAPLISLSGISKKVNFLIKQGRIHELQGIGNRIDQSVSNVKKLLDNLLSWALVQGGKFPHRPTQFNPSNSFHEIEDIYQNISGSKSIHLTFKIPENFMIYCDQNAFATIIRNLVDNAIKFTPENGTVDVEAYHQNGKPIIMIKDSGSGIHEDDLKKIFSTAEKKSMEGTAGEKGTGLGLSLCKELIEMNGGCLHLKSQLGQGTTVSLEFPELV